MKKGKAVNVLRELRAVMDLEAAALRRVRGAIDASYVRAVDLMFRCRGKVIVTGVGKSGLIGQKIAATLTATGTPAITMHPAEGMHGDLGIVRREDVILAIGKSGESDELNAILPSIKRIGAKVIALTANPRSTLARGAAVVLTTPVDAEACPLNLSPTCSTTAALAVGDALAVALMKLRGFGKEDFALYHPGGSLGKRLTLTVADIMRHGPENPVIRADRTTSQMLVEMTKKRTGAVSVVDARGKLVGLVTDYDVRRHLEQGESVLSKGIHELMNPRPVSIRSARLAVEAVQIMTERKNPFLVLPVVDGRGLAIGMIHLHDIRARGL
jgi:arabinose-5-phosphate isomerase